MVWLGAVKSTSVKAPHGSNTLKNRGIAEVHFYIVKMHQKGFFPPDLLYHNWQIMNPHVTDAYTVSILKVKSSF